MLLTIPAEVFFKIVGFLSLRDYFRLKLTCKAISNDMPALNCIQAAEMVAIYSMFLWGDEIEFYDESAHQRVVSYYREHQRFNCGGNVMCNRVWRRLLYAHDEVLMLMKRRNEYKYNYNYRTRVYECKIPIFAERASDMLIEVHNFARVCIRDNVFRQ